MPFVPRWQVVAVLLAAFLGAMPGNLAGQTARIEFRMVDQSMSAEQAMQTRPPLESEILYGISDRRAYLIEKRVVLTGLDMCDAEAGYDQRTGEPIVMFRFGVDGTKRFARVTTDNVGRAFAIVIDNEVASAPVIREPILGGVGQISGKFTDTRAKELAGQIKASAVAKC
jgi:protein-export membrane protein SecD